MLQSICAEAWILLLLTFPLACSVLVSHPITPATNHSTMSNSDDTSEYQEILEVALATLEDLLSVSTSRTTSPAIHANNYELIKQIQECMIYSGQPDLMSLGEELKNVALCIHSLQPDDDDVPLPAELCQAADVVATIKRAIHKPATDSDLENFIKQFQSAVDKVPTSLHHKLMT